MFVCIYKYIYIYIYSCVCVLCVYIYIYCTCEHREGSLFHGSLEIMFLCISDDEVLEDPLMTVSYIQCLELIYKSADDFMVSLLSCCVPSGAARTTAATLVLRCAPGITRVAGPNPPGAPCATTSLQPAASRAPTPRWRAAPSGIRDIICMHTWIR